MRRNFDSGIGNGYQGKPYDTATGLYNYGYRDYTPTTTCGFLQNKNPGKQTDRFAAFTTVDPIRDGNNWFAYVRNDPVNYVDLWGLSATDKDNRGFQAGFDAGVFGIVGVGFEIGNLYDTIVNFFTGN